MIEKMLRGVPLFAALSEDEFAKVVALAGVKGYLAGMPLFATGDPSDCFYVVARGKVSIRIPAAPGSPEREVLLGPGKFFGEMGVMRGTPRMASAVVAEDSVLVRIDAPAFDQLMAVDDELAEKVMVAFMGRAAEVEEARKAAEKASEAASQDPHVLLFYGAGAGSGASFLVANAALKVRDLTRRRVVILDLDLEAPTQHLYLGAGQGRLPALLARPEVNTERVVEAAERLHLGVDLIGGPGVPPPSHATPERVLKVVEAAREAYDYVLIDTTSALTPVNRALFEKSDLLHVVFGGDIVSVGRALPVVRSLASTGLAPRIRLVQNKFHAHVGFRPQTLEERFQRPVTGRIEFDHALAVEAANEGVPLVKRTPRCPAATDITRFVRQTLSAAPREETPERSFSLWNLLG